MSWARSGPGKCPTSIVWRCYELTDIEREKADCCPGESRRELDLYALRDRSAPFQDATGYLSGNTAAEGRTGTSRMVDHSGSEGQLDPLKINIEYSGSGPDYAIRAFLHFCDISQLLTVYHHL